LNIKRKYTIKPSHITLADPRNPRKINKGCLNGNHTTLERKVSQVSQSIAEKTGFNINEL